MRRSRQQHDVVVELAAGARDRRRRAAARSSPPAPAAPGIRPGAASSSGSRCSDGGPASSQPSVQRTSVSPSAKSRRGAAPWRRAGRRARCRRRAGGRRRGARGSAGGCPALATVSVQPLGVLAQPHQHRGGEVVQAGALEQQLVDPREHLLRLVDLAGQPAHRVAHGHRDAGRRRALAGDVADQHPAAVLGRQHVVEVAADLDPPPRRLEDDRGLEAPHPRRPRRAQAALQVAGDRVALLVEAGVVEGQRRAVAELAEELEVLRLIADVRLRVQEGDRADLAGRGRSAPTTAADS